MTRPVISVLKDLEAPASALLYVALKQYGTDCIDWHPMLLRRSIYEDFGIEITGHQSDKLQVLLLALSSDSYTDQWEVFEKSLNILSNAPDDFEYVNPINAEQLALGLAELDTSLPYHAHLPEAECEPQCYSDEVKAYVGHILYEFGMSSAPKIFPTAIFPECNHSPESDKDKSNVLDEVYRTQKDHIKDYIESIEKF